MTSIIACEKEECNKSSYCNLLVDLFASNPGSYGRIYTFINQKEVDDFIEDKKYTIPGIKENQVKALLEVNIKDYSDLLTAYYKCCCPSSFVKKLYEDIKVINDYDNRYDKTRCSIMITYCICQRLHLKKKEKELKKKAIEREKKMKETFL